MKVEIKKDTKLSFKKGLEVLDTGLFDLEDEGELSLDEKIKEYFEIGDVIKLTITKSEDISEEK